MPPSKTLPESLGVPLGDREGIAVAHTIRHGTFEANGARLHHVRTGDGGPPVVLLHGWPEFWLV
jgi:hypothetical protein